MDPKSPQYLELKGYYALKEFQLDRVYAYKNEVCKRIIHYYHFFPKLQASTLGNIPTDKLMKLGIACKIMTEALEECGLIHDKSTHTKENSADWDVL